MVIVTTLKITFEIHSLPFAKPYLQDVSIYQAGLKAGEALPAINLSANENPDGAAPSVIEAISNLLQHKGNLAFSHYPEQGSLNLRQAIANKHQLEAENIICGNGSDEIISMLLAAFVTVGDDVLYAQNGFSAYPIAIRKNGANAVAIIESNFTLTIEKILASITPKTKMILLANPNNPTGFFFTQQQMTQLHAKIPSHIVLMIDAAYAEYVLPSANDGNIYQSCLPLAKQHDNVIVTRTFSKAHGLASLRIGWAYASPQIILPMLKLMEPFNLNLLAQQAALFSLQADEFIAQSADNNTRNMHYLREKLPIYGLTPLPSQGNFLLCHAGSTQQASHIFQYMKNNGIALRHFKTAELSEYLRITIGTNTQNQQLIALLNTMPSC